MWSVVWAESEGKRSRATLEVRRHPLDPVWIFDLRWDPLVVALVVGDTTWVDDEGRTRRSDLVLRDATLVLDRQANRYEQSLRLMVAEGSTVLGEVQRVTRGTAGWSWPGPGLLFVPTEPAGPAFAGTLSGPGELTLEQTLGTAAPHQYLYVIR